MTTRWWKKQTPRGWRWLCLFGRHDDYFTGVIGLRFCSRCHRVNDTRTFNTDVTVMTVTAIPPPHVVPPFNYR